MLKTLARATGGGRSRLAAMRAAEAAMNASDEEKEDETMEEEDVEPSAEDYEDEVEASADDPSDDDVEPSAEEDDDDSQMNAAVDAETRRIKAIVTSKAGLANSPLAHELAFSTDGGRMTASRAKAILEKAGGAPTKGGLATKVAGHTHGLAPDASAPQEEIDPAARREKARAARMKRVSDASRA